MQFELDNFNGIIIDPCSLPKTITELENHLNELSAFLNREKKSIAWISLPIARADCVPVFTNAGFTFHSCVKEEVTLVRESASCRYVPFIPTHTIGAGAIVLNHAKEILLVKERGTDRFKLPGGFVDSFECIQDSIRREVFEETGIQSEFDSIVGFTTKHAYQFGKSNLHFICRMRALTETIQIIDTVEIEDAKWMPLEAYLSEDGYSLTDRQIVRTIAASSGLVSTNFSGNVEPHRRNEIFVATAKNAL